MKIMNLIAERQKDLYAGRIPTIAFLGDSVTHGCFELHLGENNRIDPVYDREHVYHRYLMKMLTDLYPNVAINAVNAGINGDGTAGGLTRLEKDVLSYHPDLTVVCFGLNDVHHGVDGVESYRQNLMHIFQKLCASGSEVIFMTSNMMNTYVSDRLESPFLRGIAQKTMGLQNDGVFDLYFEAARQAANECGAAICDVYAKWKRMYENGVDVTEHLSNYINHPTRSMHWLFANSLLETMMGENS